MNRPPVVVRALGPVLLLLLLGGCFKTLGTSSVFADPLLASAAPSGPPRTGITVAIMPNRLPLSLKDPELWVNSNFTKLSANLAGYGYRVVDRAVTQAAADKVGIPVEDTLSSRDKYAALATSLNAEYLIMPFYGTNAVSSCDGSWQQTELNAVVTLQVYDAKREDFLSRIDANATTSYQTLSPLYLAIGGALTPMILIALNNPSSAGIYSAAYGIIGIWTALESTVHGLRGSDFYWGESFTMALRDAAVRVHAVAR